MHTRSSLVLIGLLILAGCQRASTGYPYRSRATPGEVAIKVSLFGPLYWDHFIRRRQHSYVVLRSESWVRYKGDKIKEPFTRFVDPMVGTLRDDVMGEFYGFIIARGFERFPRIEKIPTGFIGSDEQSYIFLVETLKTKKMVYSRDLKERAQIKGFREIIRLFRGLQGSILLSRASMRW